MDMEYYLDLCNERIGEVATVIAQAYAEFGDLVSLYLGQTSSTLQLGLFRPLALEASIFLAHLLSENHQGLSSELVLDSEALSEELGKGKAFVADHLGHYRSTEDLLSLFAENCQEVVANDTAWLNMQKRDTEPQDSISDKGYVAICEGAARLKQVVDELPTEA
ncbi:MAG: hypothetical protein AB7C91_01410 [Sphaerochaeta sp.]|jgi:hypothetical protein|uniref:hypothetical protein n=1 Tax=Sphaerochaeta sp. TaxID=1972642 RepID=UPI003D0F2722